MKNLLKKYKSIIMYGIFGVLTTIVNIVVYSVCYENFKISNVVSTIIAWIISVIFAFITNKIFVFESKQTDLKSNVYEFIKFTGSRIFTGLIDLAIMFITVDLLKYNPTLFKIISNILVIILNYVLSKIFVFKNKK